MCVVVVVFGNILLYLCILNHNILSLTTYAYILHYSLDIGNSQAGDGVTI